MTRARFLRHEALWPCLGLLVAILTVYARSLGNAPVWDDALLVVENPNLRTLGGLRNLLTTDLWTSSGLAEPSSYYRPFTMLTYWITTIAGGSVAALRLGNVVLHAVNAVLLALLARRAANVGWVAAGLVALVWALAPVCSEPVLWIAGRFDLPVVTFALLALLASRMQGRLGLPLTLSSVAAGLLSKESFFGWIPLIVLDDLLVRRTAPGRSWVKYAALGGLVAAYLLLRRLLGIPSLVVVTQAGGLAIAESLLLLTATFLRLLIWPTALDPYRPYAALSRPGLVLAAVLLAVFFAVAAAALLRFRDSARARVALFGLAWFVLATVPGAVAGIHLDLIGDRYAYLPLVGLFLTLTALAGAMQARLLARPSRTPARALGIALLALSTCEGWLTVRRAADWRDDTALAESSLRSSPGNPYALYMLGKMAAERGDLEQADTLLSRAMAGNARSWRTWNAVCFVRIRQNRLGDAAQACTQGLSIHPGNPRGWVNLAVILVRAGRWREASAASEQALALKPVYAEARYLAAVSAANLGEMDRAREHLARGIAADPRHAGLRDLERQLREPRP